ncbi:MAG: ATP-dependent DNA helicase RecG, partial [Alphaproteobacteria bacterium]|nr:ATP-dependent DNA helicase RecG [Alphaproteobacteria bacterium]
MRPDILNPLFTEIGLLKGVGPGLAKPLARLGLERAVDLPFHLPTGVIERQVVGRLDDAALNSHVSVVVTPVSYAQGNSPRAPMRVQAVDSAGDYLSLTFFGGASNYAKKQLPLGTPKRVVGKLEQYGQERQIIHPDVLAPEAVLASREAIYPLTEGLTGKRMGALVHAAMERAPELPEWIEPGLLAARGLPAWREALTLIHADPRDGQARTRLAYDEIFANQLALMLVRASARKRRGVPLKGDGALRTQLKLPYAPTNAQTRTISEIEGDLAQSTPMTRLLQGDVGSGKTLVALHALLIAVESGAQGALLAPTEILARQHYATLSAQLVGLPINIAILTGREKGRTREATLMGLADGSIHILIGTHAIFQEGVTYKNLGLAVVDEQHRFGVSQRLMLTEKAAYPPHLLVMTATPIPRTLTLTHYGEMDVSRLDEMPPGRQPVETRVVSQERLAEVVNGLARHIEAGRQAYWVCPLVEETGLLGGERAAAEARFAALKARFGDKIGLVHGRMKGPEKDAVMADFIAARIAVLVATTVIEVGVDVPNATWMIVEEAERFGLAQLHQLRGRVGRGVRESACVLLYDPPLSKTAQARLDILRRTDDGFVIAERDLDLRGGGDPLGLKQSGFPAYRLADPVAHRDLIAAAADDARLVLARDPRLEGERGRAAA